MTTETTLPRRGRPPTIEQIGPDKFAMTIRKQQVKFYRTPRGRLRCLTAGVAPADAGYGIALLAQRFPA